MRIAPLADVKARLSAYLDKSRQSIQSGKGLPHKDFWKAIAQRYKKDKASKSRGKAA